MASAVNGLEALKYLQANNKPDLILIDLMMPVMDGYAFRTEQLKSPVWSKIPTVVMSAEANAKEKMKAFVVQSLNASGWKGSKQFGRRMAELLWIICFLVPRRIYLT